MKTITAVSYFIALFIISCFLCSVETAPNCALSLQINLDNCRYGVTRDWCNRRVCAKGPGESCGGYYLIYGSCAAGMYCLCNECTGCANLNMKCHNRGSMC